MTTCCNCKWMEGDYGWRPKETHHDGTCRRRSPIGIKNNGCGKPNVALWPHVKGGDRCGDFEPYQASTPGVFAVASVPGRGGESPALPNENPGWRCPTCGEPWAKDGAHENCPPPVFDAPPARGSSDA